VCSSDLIEDLLGVLVLESLSGLLKKRCDVVKFWSFFFFSFHDVFDKGFELSGALFVASEGAHTIWGH